MVVPVVPARMEKTAVLALGHLARAPRGTARIYFTVHARRSLARCPQPVAAVLVADLAALHSLARPTRARLRLSEPTPPSSSHLGSPVPSPYSAVHARRPTPPSSSPLSPVSRAHRCLPHTRPSFPASVPTQPSAPKLRPPGRRGRTDPPPAGPPPTQTSVARQMSGHLKRASAIRRVETRSHTTVQNYGFGNVPPRPTTRKCWQFPIVVQLCMMKSACLARSQLSRVTRLRPYFQSLLVSHTVHLGNSKLPLLLTTQLLSISINRKTENITP